MVVFTCNHCGDSLQKPRVEKHYQTTCRNNPVSLTCFDCFQDFKLQEYIPHTKCITEEQRYSAKGTMQKVQKGEVKQTEWVISVNALIAEQVNVKPGIKSLLEMMTKYDNIPRKKVKFINFIKSASGNRIKLHEMEEVWDLLEAQKIKKSKENNDQEMKISDETTSKPKLEAKTKKRKTKNEENLETKENGDVSEKSKLIKKKKSKQQNEETINNGTNETENTSESLNGDTTLKKKKSQRKNSENNEATKETPKKKKKSNKTSEENDQENGDEAINKESPKKKVRKSVEDIEEATNGNEENVETKINKTTEAVTFKQMILNVLQKKSKGISKGTLQEKVFKKYEKLHGPIRNKETLLKKYNKKIKSLKNVTCVNDTYKFIE